MKRTVLLLGALLLLIVWYPLLVICGWVNGFSVTFPYPVATLVVLTAVFSGGSIYLVERKEKTVNLVTGILSGLLPFAAAANMLVWVIESPGFFTFVLTLIWSALGFVLMLVYGKQGAWNICMGGGALLLLIPVIGLLGLLTLFSLFPIGQTTVVQTLPSPEGTHYAELIDDDQGALGGATVVNVYTPSAKIDLFFLQISKDPQQVYYGDWGKFENMKLEWESETVLLINGAPHEIT